MTGLEQSERTETLAIRSSQSSVRIDAVAASDAAIETVDLTAGAPISSAPVLCSGANLKAMTEEQRKEHKKAQQQAYYLRGK